MSLILNFIKDFPKEKQFELALHLTTLALPLWENYAANNNLVYKDSVVGLKHTVGRNLLINSVGASKRFSIACSEGNQSQFAEDMVALHKQFEDPIVALQDDDWNLPKEVELTFYSVYNFLSSCHIGGLNNFNESFIIVSINQSIEALEISGLMTYDEIKKVIDNA